MRFTNDRNDRNAHYIPLEKGPVKYIPLRIDIAEQRRGEDTEGPQDDPNIPPQNVDQQHGQGDAIHTVMLLLVILKYYSIINLILAISIVKLCISTSNSLNVMTPKRP